MLYIFSQYNPKEIYMNNVSPEQSSAEEELRGVFSPPGLLLPGVAFSPIPTLLAASSRSGGPGGTALDEGVAACPAAARERCGLWNVQPPPGRVGVYSEASEGPGGSVLLAARALASWGSWRALPSQWLIAHAAVLEAAAHVFFAVGCCVVRSPRQV
ncbi:UNVERIFIED_CONTAM: hypothetical protein K2H54_062643 [Gekko kuhli]